MKNNKLFCFIGLVVLAFASFSLSSCRDLFHSPPADPGVGVLRIEDASTGGQNYDKIDKVSIYKWGSSELVEQDTRGIERNGSLEFELSSGDYRVLIDDRSRTNVASDKITIIKDEVIAIKYDAWTGVYTYPSENNNSSTYQIGDTGPGGGTVFFAEGGSYKECSGELGTYTWDNAVTTAQSHRGGGFTNWRLPDRGELSLMYQNLKSNDLGGFTNGWYWSSMADSSDSYKRWYVNFYNGSQSTTNKDNSNQVRAVRAF